MRCDKTSDAAFNKQKRHRLSQDSKPLRYCHASEECKWFNSFATFGSLFSTHRLTRCREDLRLPNKISVYLSVEYYSSEHLRKESGHHDGVPSLQHNHWEPRNAEVSAGTAGEPGPQWSPGKRSWEPGAQTHQCAQRSVPGGHQEGQKKQYVTIHTAVLIFFKWFKW